MLLLNFKYLSLQDLTFHTSATALFRHTLRGILCTFYDTNPDKTARCHKIIITFFSVFLKIYSAAGAVNMIVISLALFFSFFIYYWV